MPGPEPLLGESQVPYSLMCRTLLVSSRFLPVLMRIQARNVSGRGHGINLNFSEKTRHFEKNCNCAISKLGSEENICKDKENL